MAKFAKLFDTPHGQLLATRDFDTDKLQHCVTLRGEASEVAVPAMQLSGWEGDEAEIVAKADNAFEQFGQEEADRYAGAMAEMLKGFVAHGDAAES